MAQRKGGLTLAEHRDLADFLKRARDEMLARIVTVGEAYPKQSRPVRRMRAALKALDAARCEMDAALCRDCPSDFSPRVYFPGELGAGQSPGAGGQGPARSLRP